VEIRLANIDDLSNLLYILNEVTLNLLQKGIHQWEYPWDHNTIIIQLKDNFSGCLHFFVAAIRTNLNNVPREEQRINSYFNQTFIFSTKVPIIPTYQ